MATSSVAAQNLPNRLEEILDSCPRHSLLTLNVIPSRPKEGAYCTCRELPSCELGRRLKRLSIVDGLVVCDRVFEHACRPPHGAPRRSINRTSPMSSGTSKLIFPDGLEGNAGLPPRMRSLLLLHYQPGNLRIDFQAARLSNTNRVQPTKSRPVLSVVTGGKEPTDFSFPCPCEGGREPTSFLPGEHKFCHFFGPQAILTDGRIR